jgi:hypothetical protein
LAVALSREGGRVRRTALFVDGKHRKHQIRMLMAKALADGKETTAAHYAATVGAAELCCSGTSCGQPVVFQDAYSMPSGFRIKKGYAHTQACDIDRQAGARISGRFLEQEQATKGGGRLERTRVHERLQEQLYTLYLNYAFFIKGAVVAVSAISIIMIFAVEVVPNRYDRVALWVTSVAFSLVTVATWIRGAALTIWRANVHDVLLPLALGITETLLYLVLAPSTERAAIPLKVWYLAFALHAGLAVGLICNRLRQSGLVEYAADPILENVVVASRRWMKLDIGGATGTALFGFLMYGLHDRLDNIVSVDIVVAGALTLVASGIIYNSMKQYRILGTL